MLIIIYLAKSVSIKKGLIESYNPNLSKANWNLIGGRLVTENLFIVFVSCFVSRDAFTKTL